MFRIGQLNLSLGLLLCSILFGCSPLAFVKGECLVVRVGRAVHQPSINGLYKRLPSTCDERDVWQRMALPTSSSSGPGKQDKPQAERYLQFGHTDDGGHGWLVVTSFCTLDTVELAAVSGELLGYPYDRATLSRWREWYEDDAPAAILDRDNATTHGWISSPMIVTCARTEYDDDYYYYDVIVVEDDSLSGAAIFGIVFGVLLGVCLLVCLLRLVRRRTVVRTRHVYYSPSPAAALLQTTTVRVEARPPPAAYTTTAYSVPTGAIYHAGANQVVIPPGGPSAGRLAGGYQQLPVAPPPPGYTQATAPVAPPAYFA